MYKKFIGPYSRDDRDYFTLLPFEEDIVGRLQNVFQDEKGLFVLCGNRGSGKSSLKNIALERLKNDSERKCLPINVSFYNGNKALYREILLQLPEGIRLRIEELIRTAHQKMTNQYSVPTPFPITPEEGQEVVRETAHLNYFEKRQEFKKVDRDLGRLQQVISELPGIVKSKNLNFGSVTKESKDLQRNLEQLERLYYDSLKGRKRFVKRSSPTMTVTEFFNRLNYFKKKVDNLEKLIEDLEVLNRLLKASKVQLDNFDSEITDLHRYVEDSVVKVSMEASVDLKTSFFDVFSSDLYSGISYNATEGNTQLRETKRVLTEELKEMLFLSLLKSTSSYFHMSLIIDELDKHKSEEIVEMIDKNKRLFLDCGLCILLITDTYSAIDLEEISDYISTPNLIVVPQLGLLDYINRLNSKGISISEDFVELLDSYYTNRMNNRYLNYNEKSMSYSGMSKGVELFKFIHSSYYRSFPQLYRNILLDFYWELLDLIDFSGELTREDYDIFVQKFIEKNSISSQKVKICMRKAIQLLLSNSFEYYNFKIINLRHRYSDSTLVSTFWKFGDRLQNEFFKNLETTEEFEYLDVKMFQSRAQLQTTLSKCFEDFQYDKQNFRDVLLELSQYSFDMNTYRKVIRIADRFYNGSNGVPDCMQVIDRENVVGVILFYPYDKSPNAHYTYQPLRNGIVVTSNDFNELILYPYIGYPGLHSHKPQYLNEFKETLTKKQIKYYEVEENSLVDIWEDCFKEDDKSLEEKILDVCLRELPKWLRKL